MINARASVRGRKKKKKKRDDRNKKIKEEHSLTHPVAGEDTLRRAGLPSIVGERRLKVIQPPLIFSKTNKNKKTAKRARAPFSRCWCSHPLVSAGLTKKKSKHARELLSTVEVQPSLVLISKTDAKNQQSEREFLSTLLVVPTRR